MKKTIIEILNKYKYNILFIFIFVGINIYLATYPSKIIGWIIDLLYDIETNQGQIITYVVYLIITAIVLLIVRLPWRSLATYTSRSFEMMMKDKIFERFLEIKLGDMQNIKNGEIMSYLTQDISEIRGFFYKCISYVSRIVATVIIVVYTMIQGVSIELTLVTLVPIIITAILVIKIQKYVETNSNRAKGYFTSLSEYVQESTDAIRTTKSYSCEEYRVKTFISKNKLLRGSNIAVEVHSTLLSICMQLCFGLCYGISIIFGSKLILEGTISIGDFIAFNGYIGLFVGPVDWLPGIISKYKSAKVSYQRLDKFFKLEREEVLLSKIDKTNNHLIHGDIEINNLTFNYPANIEVALTDINLEIKEGQTIGIMGTIGSGKTTFANLLLRLYPVQDGKIKIGGVDINDIPLPQLRKSICYITQDNFLFSTTLKDNISLFKEGYNDEDIRRSTVQSRIDSEIEQMKNGIYTMIGERGVDLSGGQKQRVVISRAFLLRSNIIIFDDTFSALDNKTEEQVLQNVRQLCQDKTCIIISNRISDVKDADKIIVLDNGKIIENGTHDELLQLNGLYKKFYCQQSSSEELQVC